MLTLPHVKKLTGWPLWEIRLVGKDNLRLIYIVEVGGKVLVLHGFIKKRQQTAPRDLQIAFKRYTAYLQSLHHI